VLGALPGLIGSIEALEAIKLIIGAGTALVGKMVYFDTLSDKDYVRVLRTRKDPKCPVCGEHPSQTGLIDYEAFCAVGAPANPDAPAQKATRARAAASAR